MAAAAGKEQAAGRQACNTDQSGSIRRRTEPPIYSDDCFWVRRGWKTSGGKPVANQELWAEVSVLLPKFKQLRFKWTKGHANSHGNVTVDQLLNSTMDNLKA